MRKVRALSEEILPSCKYKYKYKSKYKGEGAQWRDAAFWQYRGKGGGYGGNPTVIPTTMGYTVRTQRYSYTEWVYIEVLDEEVRPCFMIW